MTLGLTESSWCSAVTVRLAQTADVGRALQSRSWLIKMPKQCGMFSHVCTCLEGELSAALQLSYRCSHLPNATQWEAPKAAMVTESTFGRSEVESRLNMSQKEHAQYPTLECVASTEGQEAYTLFSISGTIAQTLPKRFLCFVGIPPYPCLWAQVCGYRVQIE